MAQGIEVRGETVDPVSGSDIIGEMAGARRHDQAACRRRIITAPYLVVAHVQPRVRKCAGDHREGLALAIFRLDRDDLTLVAGGTDHGHLARGNHLRSLPHAELPQRLLGLFGRCMRNAQGREQMAQGFRRHKMMRAIHLPPVAFDPGGSGQLRNGTVRDPAPLHALFGVECHGLWWHIRAFR